MSSGISYLKRAAIVAHRVHTGRQLDASNEDLVLSITASWVRHELVRYDAAVDAVACPRERAGIKNKVLDGIAAIVPELTKVCHAQKIQSHREVVC